MAYIDAATLRKRLPGEAPGHSDPELQVFIDDWVALFEAEDSVSRMAVAKGSESDARRAVLNRDGYSSDETVRLLAQSAESLKARYFEAHPVETYAPPDPPAYFGRVPW